jgi:hypothetical protein
MLPRLCTGATTLLDVIPLFCTLLTRRLQVEQRRRERAKECFDEIRRMLPPEFDIKPDKNSILLAVIKHIEDLRLQASSLSHSNHRICVLNQLKCHAPSSPPLTPRNRSHPAQRTPPWTPPKAPSSSAPPCFLTHHSPRLLFSPPAVLVKHPPPPSPSPATSTHPAR